MSSPTFYRSAILVAALFLIEGNSRAQLLTVSDVESAYSDPTHDCVLTGLRTLAYESKLTQREEAQNLVSTLNAAGEVYGASEKEFQGLRIANEALWNPLFSEMLIRTTESRMGISEGSISQKTRTAHFSEWATEHQGDPIALRDLVLESINRLVSVVQGDRTISKMRLAELGLTLDQYRGVQRLVQSNLKFAENGSFYSLAENVARLVAVPDRFIAEILEPNVLEPVKVADVIGGKNKRLGKENAFLIEKFILEGGCGNLYDRMVFLRDKKLLDSISPRARALVKNRKTLEAQTLALQDVLPKMRKHLEYVRQLQKEGSSLHGSILPQLSLNRQADPSTVAKQMDSYLSEHFSKLTAVSLTEQVIPQFLEEMMKFEEETGRAFTIENVRDALKVISDYSSPFPIEKKQLVQMEQLLNKGMIQKFQRYLERKFPAEAAPGKVSDPNFFLAFGGAIPGLIGGSHLGEKLAELFYSHSALQQHPGIMGAYVMTGMMTGTIAPGVAFHVPRLYRNLVKHDIPVWKQSIAQSRELPLIRKGVEQSFGGGWGATATSYLTDPYDRGLLAKLEAQLEVDIEQYEEQLAERLKYMKEQGH